MKHFKYILIGTLSTLLASQTMAAPTLAQVYKLTTPIAESIAKHAVEECQKSNADVSISVVNDQGRLMYFYRGKNSGSNTIRTSFRKAYTAASLKMPTSALSSIVEAKGYSQLGKMEDDILLLTGGLPITYKGQLIGAIGLSGSPNPLLEEECGLKAINIFEE